jgi:biopolymer transport protein ExbB
MKNWLIIFVLAGLAAVVGFAQQSADGTLDQEITKAALEYTERLRQASVELTATRERIAREKAPLLKAQRAAEDRLLAAESALTRLQTDLERASNRRRGLIKDAESLHKNTSYLNSLAQDGLKAYGDALAPGEDQFLADKLREIEAAFNDPARSGGGTAAVDAAEFLLAQVRQALGGYTADGLAMADEGSEILAGTFAFVGPQTYFRTKQGGEAGVAVRLREGSVYPVVFPVKEWTGPAVDALFRGEEGSIAADATGGKALRLKQTTGSVWDHIRKGGYVAFAILGVGALSLLLIVLKVIDVSRLAVDETPAVQVFLSKVASGERSAPALTSLRATSRELFSAGLLHMDKPKIALEEHLQALLLKQRLHFERRLPLLAVIATAAPLMGLLGTVVGMVKTFALITVFGTGNAGKLASGISEVLVATELGLAVAIPTLVIHGFLSQRIHKNLATLERQALEFVTAAKSDQEEEVPV